MLSKRTKQWKTSLASLGMTCMILGSVPAWAGDPVSAAYCQDNDQIFWFMTITDTHIGIRGSQDTDNLSWVVHEGKSVINPSFIVLAGDITDSTDGNLLGLPDGPHQSEWDEYRATLDMANTGINAGNFFDIPGNHDAYSDGDFNYYLDNSVQGQATNRTQVSWTREFDYGKYHFLGTNTSANDGRAFSIFFPYGDNAGLDTGELTYIDSELSNHNDSELTLVFGHHPMEDTGHSDDTWLFYGAPEFAALLESYGASSYTYGHTHRFSEAFFTSYAITPGVFYININSLGESSDNHFNVTAIDCNGISMVTHAIDRWPVVMITTPMDRNLGKNAHPLLGYTVPSGTGNPLRALLFDPNTSVCTAEYRIDSSTTWHPMSRVEANPNLWEAAWDTSALNEGEHTVEVRATGSEGAVRTDTIAVYVDAGTTNIPPIAIATVDIASGYVPLTVTFDGSGSTDADGTITSYVWNFGDGNTDDSGDMVTHVYQTAGSFNATLTVIDNQEAEVTSEPISIEVTPGLSSISAPTNLTAAVDGGSVSLNWTDNSSNETGFDIYRAKKIKGKYNYVFIDNVSANIDTYTDTTADIGTFKYKVRAKGTYAEEDIYSDFSNEVSVKVETSLPDPGTLTAPVLNAFSSDLNVTLTWAHDCPDGSTCTYTVERGDAKVRGQINFSQIASESTLSYVVIEESTGTYYYRVKATTDSGETSEYSNTVTARLK